MQTDHDVTHWFVDNRFEASSIMDVAILVSLKPEMTYLDESVELVDDVLQVGLWIGFDSRPMVASLFTDFLVLQLNSIPKYCQSQGSYTIKHTIFYRL